MCVPHYRAEALETIARKVLMKIDINYLNQKPQAVPIEKLIEDIYGLKIEYKYLKEHGDKLGEMVYDDGCSVCYNTETKNYELFPVKAGTILIDGRLAEDEKQYGRMRFTLAHELAHWILHQYVYTGNTNAAMLSDDDDSDIIEWQANYLAQAILMPKGQIKRCFFQFPPQGLSKKEKICRMATIFEVSKQAMEIRLKKANLIS